MAMEKRLKAVPPQAFIADGTMPGEIIINDTRFFKVKQKVIIAANALPNLTLEVKRVSDDGETMFVGPEKGNIDTRENISAYTVAAGANIFANEQLRPSVPEQETERLTYEEEPTVARRVINVDEFGRKYSASNPFPVQLSDGSIDIGTVNAELEVQLSHKDNTPDPGDVADSVRVGDGTNELKVNADGSINVVIPPGAGGIPINEFSEISSVPSGALTNILTYTVPPTYNGILYRVEVGGNNIATYEIHINGSIEARIRTWFGTSLTQICEFSSGASGFALNPGDIVQIKVIHGRPFVGDFEARLQAQLQ